MEKFREMVMQVATERQKGPLSSSQIATIDHHLQITFPSGLRTPDHPPYAHMILEAITKLDEEGGSNEESISECIKEEHKELPFAHKSFLSRYLRKLCEKRSIVLTAAKRYMICDLSTASNGLICATPPSKDYNNSLQNEECEENNRVTKRNKPRRALVFNEEDEICGAVTNNLSLTMEVKNLDIKAKEEPSKAVKRKKKKDRKRCMKTAFSDLSAEEKPVAIDMPNQMVEYIEKKDPSRLHEALVQTKFFDECKAHSNADAINKCSSYCVNCMNGALCNICRLSHKNHNLVRISQSVWENVVPVSQIQDYIDVSEIQTHLLNHRTNVSVKRTIKSRQRKHFKGACLVCKRHLPDSKFCSLYCKFEHELATDGTSATN